jgi:hypothetical protein
MPNNYAGKMPQKAGTLRGLSAVYARPKRCKPIRGENESISFIIWNLRSLLRASANAPKLMQNSLFPTFTAITRVQIPSGTPFKSIT